LKDKKVLRIRKEFSLLPLILPGVGALRFVVEAEALLQEIFSKLAKKCQNGSNSGGKSKSLMFSSLWFTKILKNIWDTRCRQMAFNMFRGLKLLAHA
jgi:hypothetical protein